MRLGALAVDYAQRLARVVPGSLIGHAKKVKCLVANLRQHVARRSAGLRALLCLLILSVFLSSVPTGVLHAHADAEPGHAHEVASPDEEQPTASDDEGPATLHFHEAAGVTQALAEPVAPVIACLPPVTWQAHPPAADPQLTPRSPPHRPPIA
jgi:hypothetical protein